MSASTPLSVSGSVEFYLEPYEVDVYSDEDSVTYTNNGNVKTRVVLEYEDENLTHEVEKDVFEPGESGEITFQYYSAEGGVISFGTEVSIQHYPLGRLDLDSEDNIGVGSRVSYLLNIGVTVGYEGYEQVQMENYEIQYKESISVKGDTENNLTFYVYPHEEIDFDMIGTDVEILDISEDTGEPLSSDEENREIELTVQFRSHHEDDGEIELILDGDNYTTEIQLTETAPEPGDEEVSFIEEEAETITFGIILIGGIVVIGAVRVLLSKKKEDDE